MARIDRARLDQAAFPVTLTVQTRFSDLDTQGHVNNAAVIYFLQEARVALDRHMGVQAACNPLRQLVASMTIEFAGEIGYPEPVEVGAGVLSIGRSSAVVGQLARQGGRSAIYAETVLVITDDTGPTPMPQRLRAAFERGLARAP